MNFAELKTSMESLFAKIQESTSTGQLPDLAVVDEFVRACDKLHMLARSGWIGEAEDFAHLAKQLLHATRKGLAEDAVMLAESLDDARNFCHRTFGSS